jgi:hypothetical protein
MAGREPGFVTRICYNRFNWQRPSGAADKSKSDAAYEGTHGFGHEEWLFDSEMLLDGWKYAHLQGVEPSRNGGRNLAGSRIDVGLYTLRGNGDREYVARVRGIEVLDDDDAAEAWQEMGRRGYVARMAKDLRDVGADATQFETGVGADSVNIRFRPESVEFDERWGRIAAKGDPLYSLPTRYQLFENDGRYGALEWRPGETPTGLATRKKSQRAAIPATEVDPVEARHRDALAERLRSVYGAECVTVERVLARGRSDIEVMNGRLRIIVEMKSDADCRMAVRSAVGQLLEYAYWPTEERTALRLVVAAPGELDVETRMFLERLRSDLKLKIEYVRSSEDPSQIRWQR